jgi:serine/threonine-protein kinase
MSKKSSSSPGQVFGRYQIRYRVAEGGMASVYLAQARGASGFEKWVALKVIHPHIARNQRFVGMFLDEARLTARLSHPNVCSVFDFGESRGTYYIAMEHLQGEPLRSVARRKSGDALLPVELAVRIVADAARGLHAAHELTDDAGEPLSLVHRDVSPQNIFVLYEGMAKVVDFGIAKARDKLGQTSTGEFKGKLAYMAPEQLDKGAVDRRTDVFALGAVLWEATTGVRLFKRDTEARTMAAVLNDPVPRPSELREAYPPMLEGIVMRALERDQDARWQSMEAMADALDELVLASGWSAGHAQVAQWMKAVFSDRIAQRTALLRAAVAPDGMIPDIELTTQSTMHGLSGSTASQLPDGIARKKWLVAGVVGLGLALGAAGFAGWYLGTRQAEGAGGGGDEPRVAVLPARDDSPDAGVGPPRVTPVAVEPPPPRVTPAAVEPPPPRVTPAAVEPPPPRADGGPAPEQGPAGPVRPATPRETGRDAGPERSASKTAPAAAPGFLNLVSIPAAEVWLGSRHLGTTPLQRVSLSSGRHVLKLRTLGTGAVKRVPVSIQPGKVSYLSVRGEP